jgi:DNA-binding response OmpR family regulator
MSNIGQTARDRQAKMNRRVAPRARRLRSSQCAETMETILVVDDCDLVRDVLVATLEKAHFVVLEAESGHKALKLAETFIGTIDLLLAAVDMPRMSGPYLAEELKKTRPGIHIMLTCGAVLVGNFGCALIQKPFGSSKLIALVNVVLHSAGNLQGTRQFAAGSSE